MYYDQEHMFNFVARLCNKHLPCLFQYLYVEHVRVDNPAHTDRFIVVRHVAARHRVFLLQEKKGLLAEYGLSQKFLV